MPYRDINEENRQVWLRKTLSALPQGVRILDAGAGKLRNRPLCGHLAYVSQDFCQYEGRGDGKGLQTSTSGFSRYWYEHHLTQRGFHIKEPTPNGDWFAYCQQELMRLGGMARRYGDKIWPLAYLCGILGAFYFKIRSGSKKADDLACFGWQYVAVKMTG